MVETWMRPMFYPGSAAFALTLIDTHFAPALLWFLLPLPLLTIAGLRDLRQYFVECVAEETPVSHEKR